jgi:hypothetical protein
VIRTEGALELAFIVDAVLKRKNTGVGADDRPEHFRGVLRVERFNAEEYEVDRIEWVELFDCRGFDAPISLDGRMDMQPARTNGFQVCAARDEGYILACLGKFCAEISTNPTTANNHDAHFRSPSASPLKESLALQGVS